MKKDLDTKYKSDPQSNVIKLLMEPKKKTRGRPKVKDINTAEIIEVEFNEEIRFVSELLEQAASLRLNTENPFFVCICFPEEVKVYHHNCSSIFELIGLVDQSYGYLKQVLGVSPNSVEIDQESD
jgi:hypothetical protein